MKRFHATSGSSRRRCRRTTTTSRITSLSPRLLLLLFLYLLLVVCVMGTTTSTSTHNATCCNNNNNNDDETNDKAPLRIIQQQQVKRFQEHLYDDSIPNVQIKIEDQQQESSDDSFSSDDGDHLSFSSSSSSSRQKISRRSLQNGGSNNNNNNNNNNGGGRPGEESSHDEGGIDCSRFQNLDDPPRECQPGYVAGASSSSSSSNDNNDERSNIVQFQLQIALDIQLQSARQYNRFLRIASRAISRVLRFHLPFRVIHENPNNNNNNNNNNQDATGTASSPPGRRRLEREQRVLDGGGGGGGGGGGNGDDKGGNGDRKPRRQAVLVYHHGSVEEIAVTAGSDTMDNNNVASINEQGSLDIIHWYTVTVHYKVFSIEAPNNNDNNDNGSSSSGGGGGGNSGGNRDLFEVTTTTTTTTVQGTRFVQQQPPPPPQQQQPPRPPQDGEGDGPRDLDENDLRPLYNPQLLNELVSLGEQVLEFTVSTGEFLQVLLSIQSEEQEGSIPPQPPEDIEDTAGLPPTSDMVGAPVTAPIPPDDGETEFSNETPFGFSGVGYTTPDTNMTTISPPIDGGSPGGETISTVTTPTYPEPLQIEWGIREWFGLALWAVTGLTFCTLALCGLYFGHQSEQGQLWSAVFTEQGIDDLLQVGWRYQFQQQQQQQQRQGQNNNSNSNSNNNNNLFLQVFDKSKIGYNDDDSVLKGGVEQGGMWAYSTSSPGTESTAPTAPATSTIPPASAGETSQIGSATTTTSSSSFGGTGTGSTNHPTAVDGNHSSATTTTTTNTHSDGGGGGGDDDDATTPPPPAFHLDRLHDYEQQSS